jgi:hypothetical protein
MKVIERLKKHFAAEKERMAPMTTRQKIDHIWTYYKEYMWIGLVVVILLGAMTSSLINLGKTDVVTGIMVNLTLDQKGMNYLQEDYHAHIGADPFWDRVKVEYTAFTSLTDGSNSEQNYYAAMTVVAEVSAEKLDYMILDKVGMEFYITQAVYMDLRNFFTEEEIAQLAAENRLIYAVEEGEDDPWVVAVDISNIAFVRDNVTSEGPIYFALAGNTKKLDVCRDIWNYLNAWGTEE